MIITKKCHACGKVFTISDIDLHVYKDTYNDKRRYFCSWTCFNHRKVEEDRRKRGRKSADEVKENHTKYDSPYVQCPFYKGESRNELLCEGLFRNSKLHFGISPPKKKVQFRRKYCEKDYERCPIAKMHFRINSGQDGDDGKI
jgi:hypothetical protein